VDACVVDWAIQIRDRVARGTIQVLDLARLIHAAKTALQRGQWTHLCRSARLPFAKRKAEMLDVIGESLGGPNAQASAHLPPGWNTLYYLAGLPQSLLASLLADGAVHPSLTLAEAKSLYARFKGLHSKTCKRPNIRLRLQRLQEFVQNNSYTWAEAERQWVRSELQELTSELGKPSDRHRSCRPV